MIDVRSVSKNQRCSAEAASVIMLWLGYALGRKFPVLDMGLVRVGYIRDFVGRRKVEQYIKDLQAGMIPLCLIPMLPDDVQATLLLELHERQIASQDVSTTQRASTELPTADSLASEVSQRGSARSVEMPAPERSERISRTTTAKVSHNLLGRRRPHPMASDGFDWCPTPGCSGGVRPGEQCPVCDERCPA